MPIFSTETSPGYAQSCSTPPTKNFSVLNLWHCYAGKGLGRESYWKTLLITCWQAGAALGCLGFPVTGGSGGDVQEPQ